LLLALTMAPAEGRNIRSKIFLTILAVAFMIKNFKAVSLKFDLSAKTFKCYKLKQCYCYMLFMHGSYQNHYIENQ